MRWPSKLNISFIPSGILNTNYTNNEWGDLGLTLWIRIWVMNDSLSHIINKSEIHHFIKCINCSQDFPSNYFSEWLNLNYLWNFHQSLSHCSLLKLFLKGLGSLVKWLAPKLKIKSGRCDIQFIHNSFSQTKKTLQCFPWIDFLSISCPSDLYISPSRHLPG